MKDARRKSSCTLLYPLQAAKRIPTNGILLFRVPESKGYVPNAPHVPSNQNNETHGVYVATSRWTKEP